MKQMVRLKLENYNYLIPLMNFFLFLFPSRTLCFCGAFARVFFSVFAIFVVLRVFFKVSTIFVILFAVLLLEIAIKRTCRSFTERLLPQTYISSNTVKNQAGTAGSCILNIFMAIFQFICICRVDWFTLEIRSLLLVHS